MSENLRKIFGNRRKVFAYSSEIVQKCLKGFLKNFKSVKLDRFEIECGVSHNLVSENGKGFRKRSAPHTLSKLIG